MCIRDSLAATPDASPSDRQWVHIRLAELAQRLERLALAEKHFRQALQASTPDGFLLAAYADLLLDQQRFGDVLQLLKTQERSDALLLRIALAEHGMNLPSAKDRAQVLNERFAAARMRKESVHEQEEARLALHLEQNAGKALPLAQDNWAAQREPRDARIFLEAALAAKRPDAAQPVLAWVQSSGIEDRYLRQLAQKLQAMKGAGK